MEPFMEYLSGEYFKHLGFIVENQIPLAHAIGSPDFAGYGLSEIIEKISKYGFLSKNGFHIIELALIRIYKKENSISDINVTHDFIVGEAKTGNLIMTKQLEKYLDTGLFDIGFEIQPRKSKPAKNYFGLITLDSEYRINIIQPESKFIPAKSLSREEYSLWLENYIKFYLISNLTNDELKQYYREVTSRKINVESEIVDFVLKISIDDILKKIKEL